MYQDTYSKSFGAENIIERTVKTTTADETFLIDDYSACINTVTSSNTESWWTGRFKGQWDVTKVNIMPDKQFPDSLAGA